MTQLSDEKSPIVIVVGGGTMGSGVSQRFLLAAYRVSCVEVDDDAGARVMETVTRGLSRWAVKTGQQELRDQALARFTVHADGLPDVLASNTSALSIDTLARSVDDPGRFLGMHFFNPVPRSALLEIVRGDSTRPDVLRSAHEHARRLGLTPVEVRDSPGFATSRLGIVVGLEAMRMVEEDIASAADIDTAMMLGYRFPVGPLELSDLVGLDVRLAIAEHLHTRLGERFKPPGLLRAMVRAGLLGTKTGQGFYVWDGTTRVASRPLSDLIAE
jgi:3-hydroxybutyryl-CoA dehydrogenase